MVQVVNSKESQEDKEYWEVYVDGASNAKDIGVWILISTPNKA